MFSFFFFLFSLFLNFSTLCSFFCSFFSFFFFRRRKRKTVRGSKFNVCPQLCACHARHLRSSPAQHGGTHAPHPSPGRSHHHLSPNGAPLQQRACESRCGGTRPHVRQQSHKSASPDKRTNFSGPDNQPGAGTGPSQLEIRALLAAPCSLEGHTVSDGLQCHLGQCYLGQMLLRPMLVWSRRGFTRQPENSKRAHLMVPALQKHHHNST